MTDSDPTGGSVPDLAALVRAAYAAFRRDSVAQAVRRVEERGERLDVEHLLPVAEGIIDELALRPDDVDAVAWGDAVREYLRPAAERMAARAQQHVPHRDDAGAAKRAAAFDRLLGPETPDTPLARTQRRLDREWERDEAVAPAVGSDIEDEIIAICEAEATMGRPVLTDEWTDLCGDTAWEERLAAAEDAGHLRILRVGDMRPAPRGLPLAASAFQVVRENLPTSVWRRMERVEKAARAKAKAKARPLKWYHDPEQLQQRYDDVGSIKQLSERTGVSRTTLRNALSEAGIATTLQGRPRVVDSTAVEVG